MLFKKNPSAMPQLVAFAFFDDSITPDLDGICANGGKLLKAHGSFRDATVEVIEQERDQIGFMIAGDSGCLIQRMLLPFPAEKLDPDDPNRQRVVESQEHWGFVLPTQDNPMHRLIDLIKLSILMQSISMTHRVRGLVPSPLGVVFRASEWGEAIKNLVNDQILPLRHWVGYDYREESGQTDAASIYMDELFGISNVEILNSARSPGETVDLLECAVIDSIMHGPLHKKAKQWVTKTGVLYTVRYSKSMYDPARKATQLIESR